MGKAELTHRLLCRPLPAVTNVGRCPTSDVITFDQNWHHLYSNSAGGRDLSNETHFGAQKCLEI
jgi:hypothetical protein